MKTFYNYLTISLFSLEWWKYNEIKYNYLIITPFIRIMKAFHNYLITSLAH